MPPASRGLPASLRAARIHDLLASHAAAVPLKSEAAVDGDLRLTYGELAARVDAIARALIAAGVQPGDRVATLTPPALDFWLTYLATVSIGATWLGLNPRYQTPEYAYLLGDAEPVPWCSAGRPMKAATIWPTCAASRRRGCRFVTLDEAASGVEGFEAFVAIGRGYRRCGPRRAPGGGRPGGLSRSSSIPRAPPASPRARCCRTAPSWRRR